MVRYSAEQKCSDGSQHERDSDALAPGQNLCSRPVYDEQLTQVTSEFSTPKSCATSVTVKDTVKKSKASHVLEQSHISPSFPRSDNRKMF